jgi:hypothetical protein
MKTFRCVKESKCRSRRVFTGNDKESLYLKDQRQMDDTWRRKVEDKTFVKGTEREK